MIPELGSGVGLGVLLQFLRSNSKCHELVYLGILVGGAGIVAWIMGVEPTSYLGPERKAAWENLLKIVIGSFSGTQGTSTLANLAKSMGANASHPLVPVTNSK
jgi:hypothetical protein